MSRRGRGARNRNHSKGQGNNRPGGDQPKSETRSDNRSDHRQGNRQDPRAGQRQEHRHDHRQDNRPGQDQGASSENRQQPGKITFPSALQPKKTLSRPVRESNNEAPREPNRRYRVVFFDTLAQAKSEIEALKTQASGCDQLNIVVRAEAPMDDHDLTSIGKLFCGAAWALIHERRRVDGWYESPHD